MIEELIQDTLREAIGQIQKKNLAGALDTLICINFNQLLPSIDSRTLQKTDHGRVFGLERVREEA